MKFSLASITGAAFGFALILGAVMTGSRTESRAGESPRGTRCAVRCQRSLDYLRQSRLTVEAGQMLAELLRSLSWGFVVQ